MTVKKDHREIAFTACCMWEVSLKHENLRFGDGAVEHRYWCVDNAKRCHEVYEAMLKAVPDFDAAFDWVFVPEFMVRCVDKDGNVVPDAVERMIKFATGN